MDYIIAVIHLNMDTFASVSKKYSQKYKQFDLIFNLKSFTNE